MSYPIKKARAPFKRVSMNPSRPLSGELGVAALLVLLVVVTRLSIEIPNFQPVMAVSLLSGFFFRRRTLAVGVPLVAMLLTDALLGWYQWQLVLAVYLALLLPVFLGMAMSARTNTSGRIFAQSIAWTVLSAAVFFTCSNLAVWAFTSWYSFDINGLVACFALALPFLKWTLLANLGFTALLFGGFLFCCQAAEALSRNRRIKQQAA